MAEVNACPCVWGLPRVVPLEEAEFLLFKALRIITTECCPSLLSNYSTVCVCTTSTHKYVLKCRGSTSASPGTTTKHVSLVSLFWQCCICRCMNYCAKTHKQKYHGLCSGFSYQFYSQTASIQNQNLFLWNWTQLISQDEICPLAALSQDNCLK